MYLVKDRVRRIRKSFLCEIEEREQLNINRNAIKEGIECESVKDLKKEVIESTDSVEERRQKI